MAWPTQKRVHFARDVDKIEFSRLEAPSALRRPTQPPSALRTPTQPPTAGTSPLKPKTATLAPQPLPCEIDRALKRLNHFPSRGPEGMFPFPDNDCESIRYRVRRRSPEEVLAREEGDMSIRRQFVNMRYNAIQHLFPPETLRALAHRPKQESWSSSDLDQDILEEAPKAPVAPESPLKSRSTPYPLYGGLLPKLILFP